MSKHFTKEEIEQLKLNPYVNKVSETTITYTQEFREHFVIEFKNGKLPTQILREAGFVSEVLGKQRIDSSSARFKQMAKREKGFSDTRKENSGRPSAKDLTPEEEISRLKHKIKYLQQENQFLKKIDFLDRKALREQNRKKSSD